MGTSAVVMEHELQILPRTAIAGYIGGILTVVCITSAHLDYNGTRWDSININSINYLDDILLLHMELSNGFFFSRIFSKLLLALVPNYCY